MAMTKRMFLKLAAFLVPAKAKAFWHGTSSVGVPAGSFNNGTFSSSFSGGGVSNGTQGL